MTEELATLKAENERLREQMSRQANAGAELIALRADRDQLATQLRACERDAQRLDWLESRWTRGSRGDCMNPPVTECRFVHYSPGKVLAQALSLREAIDAASTPTPGKE